MNLIEAERLVRDELAGIAPEAAATQLDPEKPLRDQIELDSFDFLTLVTRVHERTGVDIAEKDYPRLQTLRGFAAHVASAVG